MNNNLIIVKIQEVSFMENLKEFENDLNGWIQTIEELIQWAKGDETEPKNME